MLRRTSIYLSVGDVSPSQWTRFVRVLNECGLAAPTFHTPASVHELQRAPFSAFSPLFTTAAFSFHDHQLTTLGDVLIDEYLSERIMDYALHMGHVLSVNTVNQLNAVFHHHFSLTLFAQELHLEALALPFQGPREDAAAAAATGSGGNCDAAAVQRSLDFLEASHPAPRKRDLNGTTFQIAPLRSGQNPLGWKFSHFIGALHQVYGSAGTSAALENLYGLTNAGNIPEKASRLLVRVLQESSPMNVAESLLAAQGLAVRFVAKTRHIGAIDQDDSNPASSPPQPGNASSSTAQPQHSDDHSVVMVTGFSADSQNQIDSVSLDALAGSPERLRESSLAFGPGLVDAQRVWWERTSSLVQAELEPDPRESLEDGWLTPTERRTYQDGPAFAHTVDFRTVTHTYADTYGLMNPTDGKLVARRRFTKPARDPLFYDKMSDMRNGVPFNTDGTPLAEFLDHFHAPHKRLFEVTMLAGGDGGRTVGRAIATRYTTARESACKAYIGGVLNDIHLIQRQSPQQQH